MFAVVTPNPPPMPRPGQGPGQAPGQAPGRSRGATPDGRRRVVIAEDEALIRLDLAEMLVEEGYDVVGQAEDGEKAVELAVDLRPDLVILDVKMPRLDGIAAAEQIAGQRIAPVVILTAFSQRDLVERARDAGAMAYLVKPFDQTDLVPAIEMAVSRFAEVRQLESEVQDLSERLETRKAVDRAKGILQQSLGLSEPESFRWIQKTAMDLRLSMRQVADGVVAHGPSMDAPQGSAPEGTDRSS
jgi:AmiR/NasT family two-component response regulator